MRLAIATIAAAFFATGVLGNPYRFDRLSRDESAAAKRADVSNAGGDGQDMQRANKARSIPAVEYDKLVEALGVAANKPKARSIPAVEYDKLVEALGSGANKPKVRRTEDGGGSAIDPIGAHLSPRSFPTEQYDKLVSSLGAPGDKARRAEDSPADPIGGGGHKSREA